MILFQANNFQLDMTLFGLTLNEENNMYVDNLIKSYSFPFKMAKADVFGLSKVTKGTLQIDNLYYNASLRIGYTKGEEVEVTLYYGEEELAVYSTKMANLPWPINIVLTTQQLANKHLDSGWPEVTHNFPAIYRPEIKESADYESFQFFVNNYNGNDFVNNLETVVESVTTYNNRNVLSPCAYLVEMIAFGYKVEGKKVRGSFFEDEKIQKLVYIPEQFLEKFRGSTFTNWQFSLPDEDELLNNDRIGVYRRVFAPSASGTYNVKFNLELDEVTASYFSLRIFRKNTATEIETSEFSASSVNNRVSINKEININLTGSAPFEQIWVELRLKYSAVSINGKNSFEYAFKEGRLNELDSSYSLSSFMPDMTHGEFVNAIKNWLNLDVSLNDEFVTIELIENNVQNLTEYDHSHLEELRPKVTENDSRVFKLKYVDNTEVLIANSGQIYSDAEIAQDDMVTIEMDVQMAVVEDNYTRITAVYPDDAGLTFAIYDGLNAANRNLSVDSYQGFTGKIESVYENYWKNWLFRRTGNKTILDKFKIHFTETLDLRSKIFKYNSFLLPLRIRKKRDSTEYWEVEMESETI